MTFDIGYMQANPIRWGPGEIDESEEGGKLGNGENGGRIQNTLLPYF